jgi:HK97 family phage major capsid protein
MSKLKELREERARAHKALTDNLAGADSAESRGRATELIKEMDRLQTECDKITSRGLSAIGEGMKNDKETGVEYRRPFQSYLRKGENHLNEEERTILGEHRDIAEGNLANQIGTYTGLGYFVPAGFVYDVEVGLKYFCPFLDSSICTIMDTATGAPLPYPINNDTGQLASIVGEAAVVSEQDVTAGHVDFTAFKYSSGLVKASLELLQDSAFPLESFLAERFALRFGRKFENDLTSGSGVAQPTGLLTAIATSGASAITAIGSSESTGGSQTGVNSIGYSDLVNLEHSVDPSYRRNAKYMFHDQTLSSLQRVLDKFGRPIWTPGVAENVPDRINGYPYVINQSMPQIAATNTTMIFGDFSKFIIRRVKGFSVMVLRERYAELGQVAYLGFMRIDSNLVDAGTHPLNVLVQHS